MKNFASKVEAASKIEDLNKTTRRGRRFLAAITRKIVDKKVVEKGVYHESLGEKG